MDPVRLRLESYLCPGVRQLTLQTHPQLDGVEDGFTNSKDLFDEIGIEESRDLFRDFFDRRFDPLAKKPELFSGDVGELATDGVVVGVEVGVFVRIDVGKLVDEDVSTEAGVSTKSVAAVGVFEGITLGLMVGVARIRGGVGNGWTVSIGVAGTVKNGIGTAGNSYCSMDTV